MNIQQLVLSSSFIILTLSSMFIISASIHRNGYILQVNEQCSVKRETKCLGYNHLILKNPTTTPTVRAYSTYKRGMDIPFRAGRRADWHRFPYMQRTASL